MQPSSKQVLCEDLITLLKHTKTTLAALAEKYGLTHMQLYAMKTIHHGASTMGKVADGLHCDASNVTGIIDRLVALGLVDRRESEEDRRAKVLHLTDKGQALLDQIAQELPEALGCGKLSPAERAAFHELICRLV